MRRTALTLAAAVPALLVVAATWLRLEQPVTPLWRVLALAGLALGAAAVPGRLQRVAATAVAIVLAARVGAGVWLVPLHPLDPGSGFGLRDALSTIGTRFGDGFSDFYGTHLPFDPRVHTAMNELVLTAIFWFALAIALLAAARKPLAAALVLLLGAGWPATLLGPSHGVAIGAAILAAALVLLAGLGSRRVPALALPAVAVVAAGAVAVGSATAAGHGLVHWQSWNLTHAAAGPVDVGFVWDAQYGGLKWSGPPTVVLEVKSATTPSYLRATVLDDFSGNAWATGVPRPADGLEPAAALQPRNETQQRITVDGLADNHLVGGSIPVRFQAGSAPVTEPERGFALLPEELPRGFSYTAWSYSPRPTVAELRSSPPTYPSRLANDGMLDVGQSVSLPPFGTPGRKAAVEALITRTQPLYQYLPLARLAEAVAGNARTPYDVVQRLEDWFVISGGFRYSNHPQVIAPPLVGFVTQTRAGYCQYFAGAMALMLRYLGIPARVAVGFAGGAYDKRHVWIVTDRNAHAWVEVWFKGYGWLPFDPTPAALGSSRRPSLAGTPALAGGGQGKTPGAAGSGKGAGSASIAAKLARQNGFVRPQGRSKSSLRAARSGSAAHGGSNRLAVLILLLAAALVLGGIVLAKAVMQAARRLRRDPRRVAAACREGLAAFLADQGVEAPRSATLYELGELVRREFGAEPDPFVAAAMAARFGRAEEAPAAARAARAELRDLLDGARRALTWTQRLRGLLSLRSLVRPAPAGDASSSLGSTTA
jgi:transglutaminase superfamily protein/transglutaminase TgpA-like protein